MNKKLVVGIIVALVVLALGVGAYLLRGRTGNSELESAGFDYMHLEVYKSRSSQDDTKQLQTTFVKDDPIQVKLNYKALSSDVDTIIMFIVYKLDNGESRDKSSTMDSPTKIPLKSEGERYITISSGDYTTGKYRVEIWNEAGSTLATTDFEIQ